MTFPATAPGVGVNDQIAGFEGVTRRRPGSLNQVTDPTVGHPLETGNLR